MEITIRVESHHKLFKNLPLFNQSPIFIQWIYIWDPRQGRSGISEPNDLLHRLMPQSSNVMKMQRLQMNCDRLAPRHRSSLASVGADHSPAPCHIPARGLFLIHVKTGDIGYPDAFAVPSNVEL